MGRSLRYRPRRVRKVVHRTASAALCIGRLEPGVRVTGVTAGQFSAIDALEHMANECGSAVARISTWTTGLYDAARAAELGRNEALREVRMLLDRGTFEKSPKFAGPLIEVLGEQAIRCLSVHAKVTIVHGERASAVWRSSMNLNKNLRTEQFDIDVEEAGGGEVVGFYTEWFDALWEESGRSQSNAEIIRAIYDRYEALPDEAKAPAASDAGDDDLAAVRLDGALWEDGR